MGLNNVEQCLPKPKAFNDVRMCNCADPSCGRELVGLADREQAFYLGLQVATYVLDRPYCTTCARGVGAKERTCAKCGEMEFLRNMRAKDCRFYCLKCPAAAIVHEGRQQGWQERLLGLRSDAHERTHRPGAIGYSDGLRDEAAA